MTGAKTASRTRSGRRPGPPSSPDRAVSVEAAGRPRKAGGAAPLQSLLWRRPWLRSLLLLTPPLGWFVVIYLASLVLLLVTAFWQINDFTTQIEEVWNLDNFRTILFDPTYRLIIGRTVVLAV